MALIYYYIRGELLHGRVNSDYLAESIYLDMCNIFPPGATMHVHRFRHPTDGVFYSTSRN